MSTAPLVLIVMGSESDLPVMQEASQILSQFGVPWEMRISSAHRSPARTMALASEAAERGIKSSSPVPAWLPTWLALWRPSLYCR